MRTRDKFNSHARAYKPILDFRNKDIVCFGTDFARGKLNEFPYIELVEYELKTSNVVGLTNYFFEHIGKKDAKDLYKGLYVGRPTGYVYILPYLTDEHHTMQQNWQSINGTGVSVVDFAVNTVVGIQKVVTPAAGIIFPKTYSGAAEQSVNITFDLVNTTETDINATVRNKGFLERLINSSLHNVKDAVAAVIPPCMYEVYIPGVKWIPVAVVQGLRIENKGTMNNWDSYIIPDAWGVTIQLRELINESRNLYDEAIKGYSSGSQAEVRVITTGLNGVLQTVVDAVTPTPTDVDRAAAAYAATGTTGPVPR